MVAAYDRMISSNFFQVRFIAKRGRKEEDIIQTGNDTGYVENCNNDSSLQKIKNIKSKI